MADYRNLTDALLLKSQSPSGSKDGEFDTDGSEKTAVFHDTTVLDSPVNEIETHSEKVCSETEVVHDDDDDDDLGHMEVVKVEPEPCELDMEIVLDSEDEGSCSTKAVTLFDGSKIIRSEKKVAQKRERQSPCLDADSTGKQLDSAKKGSSINHDSSDGKKDVPQLSVGGHEIGRLEYVNLQEPEESSQANALSFVDNFLTFNNVDMCQGIEERMRKKSPLVSSAKGTQRLAKIIKRGSPVKEMGNFEWFDSCQLGETDSFSNRTAVSSEFGDLWQRTDKSRQNLHNKGQRSFSDKHEEEFADLNKDIRGLSHSYSSFKVQGSKVSIGLEKESEMNFLNGSIKELDELMQTNSSSEKFEASGTTKDIPDMFDVGIGTQIAAEAMEALYYGLPFGCKAGDSCEGLEDTLTDLLEGETKGKTHLEQHSLQKVAACELVEVAKVLIRRKRSARRYSKDFSSTSWKYNYQELSHKTKPKTCKSKKSRVDESVSSNNLKTCEIYVSPSIADEQTSLRKQLSQEEPVIHQTRHWQGGVSMQRTEDQPDKPRAMTNNVEGSMLTYKRKRKRVVADPPKLLSGKQKCSKLHNCASAEALDGRLSEQQQCSPQEAALARFFRFDAWNCPKRKRTHHKVPSRSDGLSNMYASFTSVGAEKHNLDFVRSQKMPEDDEIDSNNFNMKEQTHTSLSRPLLENNSDESLSRQNCNEQIACIVTSSDSAVTTIRISAGDLDRAGVVQTDKLDFVDSTSIINGLKNHTFGESLRKSIELSGTECNTTFRCTKTANEASLNNRPYVYHRRPCNKNLPKPSLLKELMGLGVPESVSDFTARCFRTRKELANIRVLFSQHLDDDVTKWQKKISARLGISITSYSMDATHFIADKFVRTRNMLEAIAVGKPVVTHLWLDSCGQASCLLDEKNYILRDFKREKEIGFSMAVSLARARQNPLLKDTRVCITPNVKPNKEVITTLVKAVGGEVVETIQELAAEDQKIPDDLLILSCEQDLAICTPLLEKGAPVYNSELLLNGIVIQKLEYDRHQLVAKSVRKKERSQRGIDKAEAQGNLDLST